MQLNDLNVTIYGNLRYHSLLLIEKFPIQMKKSGDFFFVVIIFFLHS